MGRRHYRRSGVVGVVAVVLATTLTGASSAPSAPQVSACQVSTATTPLGGSTPGPPPVPAQGAYFGGFSLTGGPTQANLVNSFNALQDDACRPLDIAHIYLRWGDEFPTDSARTLAEEGAYPLISWAAADTRTINTGALDPMITATAREIASLHTPVFFEFRWEMDRPGLASVIHSPTDFVAAWDRVHLLFAQAGATNVSWVWCPTAAGFADGQAQAYYPGDNNVDWVCADAYPPDTAYHSLQQLIQPFLTWAQRNDKPVMIGEYGVPLSYTNQQRAQWFAQARASIIASPRIKAVAYFDNNPANVPPVRQYAIGNDPGVLAAFRAFGTDPYFNQR